MRMLFLLRGAPGAGKSTWVKDNDLERYTLSADNIRLMYQCPIMNIDGNYTISQNNDGNVWNLLMELLEQRMERGELIIIDATHYKSELLNRYKNLVSKYRYRNFVVDFTQVPLETALERNKERDAYKFVPEAVIRKMYAVFEADQEVSKRFYTLTPDEASNFICNEEPFYDYSNYKEVQVFGDIHGCYEPLKQWFEEHPFDKDIGYVFTGDYIDRGLQNKETLEFLMDLSQNKNVLLLEGNHEKWLRMYADDNGAEIPVTDEQRNTLSKKELKNLLHQKIRSAEFLEYTMPQIKDISKKDLRQFCRKFAQMAYFYFAGEDYFICHGGYPTPPDWFTPAYQLINGVGKYEDTDKLYEALENETDCIFIHAHRNVYDVETEVVKNKIYNLCDKVETGGDLRILQIKKKENLEVSEITVHRIKNTMPNERIIPIVFANENVTVSDNNKTEIINQLEKSKLIKKTVQGHITSYNFTKDAFKRREWNNLTCTARGLFIYNSTGDIAARGYSKFFNRLETENTTDEVLKDTLEFPVIAYKKENGFLGLISYDREQDKLLFCSKTLLSGEYSDMLRYQFSMLTSETRDKIEEYLKENNVTMAFEVIDSRDKSHPIWYEKDHLYLLDIIDNTFEFKKKPYDEVRKIAKDFKIEVKKVAACLNNWNILQAFIKHYESNNEPFHEGYVLEDPNGFMFKYKTPFYKYWKYKRGLLESISKNKTVRKNFVTEQDVRVYNIIRDLKDKFGADYLRNLTIKDIEKMYYENKLLPAEKII